MQSPFYTPTYIHACMQASTKVPMPESTATLLSQLPMDVSIVGPSPSTTSPYPKISGYLTVDPFKVAGGSIEMTTPKALSGGCCSGPKSCCS